MKPLSESDLDEIERMAQENAGEPYRGPLLALVGEVRRLRRTLLDGRYLRPLNLRPLNLSRERGPSD